MKVIVPKLVEYSIKNIGNKTLQRNALRVYAALYLRNKRKNNNGYFDVPSRYMIIIHSRYYIVIKRFVEDGIIDYYKTKQQGKDIFTTIEKKFYSNRLNLCMMYKFLINPEIGKEIDVDFDKRKEKKWYKLTESSLKQLGIEDIRITRDDFGRRVHHNLIPIYKKVLEGKGYCVIDSICSQPRLLWLMMKKRNSYDPNYFNIFENDIDFYGYCVDMLKLQTRQDAKDLFMLWLNGEDYYYNRGVRKLFPETDKFIRSLKFRNYKDSSSFLQREEAKIWVDDLLENLPVKFGLTIHDSLVVKDKDVTKVFKYCQEKYPELRFKITEL